MQAPLDFGIASSLLLAVANVQYDHSIDDKADQRIRQQLGTPTTAVPTTPKAQPLSPALTSSLAKTSKKPPRRRRTACYFLTIDEWTLVEQILLRGPAAWNTFLSISSASKEALEGPILSVAEFYHLLQSPPNISKDTSSSPPVTFPSHPSFVVACSFRVRIVLLELYYYYPWSNQGEDDVTIASTQEGSSFDFRS
jgi:hypothetical protein